MAGSYRRGRETVGDLDLLIESPYGHKSDDNESDGNAAMDHFGRFPGDVDAPPRPDAIARIAGKRYESGERGDPAQLHPLYLRASEPELRRR